MQSSDWTPAFEQPDLLGESPFWHPLERLLYWVDIPGRKLLRGDPQDGRRETWDMPSEPGCIAPVRGGGLVIALRDGIYRAQNWGGTLALLARFPHDPALVRFNDGKCDSQGRFWASTVYEPKDKRGADLWCLDMRGGKAEAMLKACNATTGNGMAWTPDESGAFWSDTPRHRIHAWDYESATGVLRRHRVFRQFPPKPEGWTSAEAGARPYGGRPDGAAMDSAGRYHCAMFEGSRLLRIDADGVGESSLALPAVCPTMPCFGGEDLRTLFVTTSREKRPPEELQRTPLAGRVLQARVEVAGLPVNFFDPGPGG
ncbi:SMP-30/gluconolactonase/LRE family protein [Xylophilus rhododendri]|uniref:SMP-30/gluconolactonase/LRE family protein n=1 Tax=Xylophilus rhododendri TaxID=2697032 RepID=A0A857J7N8_9BURK|nr:SMP-30/gluconolactonase/LRE family protein [Xylophilus rhododendri]QHI99022.1 SMP-30/gluconolactonase/LRE family protein [Xylophilus rhododendri]